MNPAIRQPNGPPQVDKPDPISKRKTGQYGLIGVCGVIVCILVIVNAQLNAGAYVCNWERVDICPEAISRPFSARPGNPPKLVMVFEYQSSRLSQYRGWRIGNSMIVSFGWTQPQKTRNHLKCRTPMRCEFRIPPVTKTRLHWCSTFFPPWNYDRC